MTPQPERALAAILPDMIVERQRLLIREANYLRGLVGLPPVKVEREREEQAAVGDMASASCSGKARARQ